MTRVRVRPRTSKRSEPARQPVRVGPPVRKPVTRAVAVKHAAPAVPDDDTGAMPPRISRRKRKTKHTRTPLQERRRAERATERGDNHPHFPPRIHKRKHRITAAAPVPPSSEHPELTPVAETRTQRRARLAAVDNRQQQVIAQNAGTIYRRYNEYLAVVQAAGRNVPPRYILDRWFRELFEEGAPRPRTVDPVLVDNRIRYELLRRGFLAAGINPPHRVQVNARAAERYAVTEFTDHMRSLVEAQMGQHPHDDVSEGETMSAPAKKTKKKTAESGSDAGTGEERSKRGGLKSGLTQVDAWLNLFEVNRTEKKTDAQLLAKMRADFPGAPRLDIEGIIASQRARYNAGKLKAQGGKVPASPIHGFNKEGKPIKGTDVLATRGRKPKAIVEAGEETPATATGTKAPFKPTGGKGKKKVAKKKTVLVYKDEELELKGEDGEEEVEETPAATPKGQPAKRVAVGKKKPPTKPAKQPEPAGESDSQPSADGPTSSSEAPATTAPAAAAGKKLRLKRRA